MLPNCVSEQQNVSSFQQLSLRRVPVDTSNANWAPAVWAGVIVLSIISYFVHGRKHYTPPIVFVEGKRVGGLQGTA